MIMSDMFRICRDSQLIFVHTTEQPSDEFSPVWVGPINQLPIFLMECEINDLYAEDSELYFTIYPPIIYD